MAQFKTTSLNQLLANIEKDLQTVRDEFLTSMAEDLVEQSKPTVDTGAYITSHSITTTRGAGRSRTSHGKPRKQSPEQKAAESLNQLMGDIAGLSPDETNIYLTNNAPHANLVEYKHGYAIYSSVRNRAKIHLIEAIAKVRGRV